MKKKNLNLSCDFCCDGKIRCVTCDGNGSVKWYKELCIKKDFMADDFVKTCERSIPERILKKCRGEIIVNEKMKKVDIYFIFIMF